MSYELETGETSQDVLRRCAREQLDEAIGHLTNGMHSDPVQAVHSARKALKKERSLLRLGRGALPKGQRRKEASAFRQVARGLSAARDADVMVQALDQLADRYAGQVPETSFAAVRERLEAQREESRRLLVATAAVSDGVAQLGAARLRVDSWTVRSGGWQVLGPGLVGCYRAGTKAFEAAQARPTQENLHAWRKRSKDAWYQLRLLAPIAPGPMQGLANEAHRLSELLGDHHDLSELRQALSRIAVDTAADLDSVAGLIDHRRGQLQTDAFFVGARVYAERPQAFARRVHRYWKAWQAEAYAASLQRPAELAEATRASALT